MTFLRFRSNLIKRSGRHLFIYPLSPEEGNRVIVESAFNTFDGRTPKQKFLYRNVPKYPSRNFIGISEGERETTRKT
jgi:hypothetical protein